MYNHGFVLTLIFLTSFMLGFVFPTYCEDDNDCEYWQNCINNICILKPGSCDTNDDCDFWGECNEYHNCTLRWWCIYVILILLAAGWNLTINKLRGRKKKTGWDLIINKLRGRKKKTEWEKRDKKEPEEEEEWKEEKGRKDEW